ncbi:DJ-1/PfpI family protein [soil metagenome]
MANSSLLIGGLVFPDLDQADFTGPFEILSRIPHARFFVISPDGQPVTDARGLILTPHMSFSEAPAVDVLLVPGGSGVNAIMENEFALTFVKKQAASAKLVFAVCTGALICGAAGLLVGRRATTHWASHHLLSSFGAIPQNARVVVDGNLVTAAGVTSGLDASLQVAAIIAGDDAARQIQLYLEYAPEPPFDCGSPETTPPEIVAALRHSMASVLEERRQIAERFALSRQGHPLSI